MSMPAKYTLTLTPAASRDLDGIHGKVKNDVLDALAQLEQEPRGHNVQKLKAMKIPTYRKKVRSFRIVFHIDDNNKTLIVTKISDRKDVYD